MLLGQELTALWNVRKQLSGLSRATIYTRYLPRPSPIVPGALLVRQQQSFG